MKPFDNLKLFLSSRKSKVITLGTTVAAASQASAADLSTVTLDPALALSVAGAVGLGLAGLIVAKWAIGFLRRG